MLLLQTEWTLADLTDVTLVSDDTYLRLYWCDHDDPLWQWCHDDNDKNYENDDNNYNDDNNDNHDDDDDNDENDENGDNNNNDDEDDKDDVDDEGDEDDNDDKDDYDDNDDKDDYDDNNDSDNNDSDKPNKRKILSCSDKSYSVIKSNEIKRNDSLWRFGCSDVCTILWRPQLIIQLRYCTHWLWNVIFLTFFLYSPKKCLLNCDFHTDPLNYMSLSWTTCLTDSSTSQVQVGRATQSKLSAR